MYRDHGQHLAKNSGHAWSSWHKIGLHMAGREQAWASVSSVYVGPQKNTRRPQKEPRRPQKEPRRPQKEPRRPQKEPRKLQQSVSKREQCILMSQPIVWFFELLITTYTCCWGFSALLKFTRLDIPRLSRRSTFSDPLGWDLAFWGLWTFRVLHFTHIIIYIYICVYPPTPADARRSAPGNKSFEDIWPLSDYYYYYCYYCCYYYYYY